MTLELTRHVERRLRQRGLRECDLEFVLRHGSHLGDAVVLTNKDAEAAIAEHRREIARLGRLRGTAVFTKESAVVTVFRPSDAKLRQMRHCIQPMRRVRDERARRRMAGH
jgi:hypothetical protein